MPGHALRLLLLLIACCAGWTSPASAMDPPCAHAQAAHGAGDAVAAAPHEPGPAQRRGHHAGSTQAAQQHGAGAACPCGCACDCAAVGCAGAAVGLSAGAVDSLSLTGADRFGVECTRSEVYPAHDPGLLRPPCRS